MQMRRYDVENFMERRRLPLELRKYEIYYLSRKLFSFLSLSFVLVLLLPVEQFQPLMFSCTSMSIFFFNKVTDGLLKFEGLRLLSFTICCYCYLEFTTNSDFQHKLQQSHIHVWDLMFRFCWCV